MASIESGRDGGGESSALRPLPSGVVSFVLTDIVGSTRLWEADAGAMAAALERHDELVESCVAAHDGVLLKSKGEGDSTFSVFSRAQDAVIAAVAIRSRLREAVRAPPLPVRVGVVTGEAIERGGDYYGTTVNLGARLRSLAEGGEILVSEATAGAVRERLPQGLALRELGRHHLPGLSRPEAVWSVGRPGDGVGGPARRVPLPPSLTIADPLPCVGRDGELDLAEAAWPSQGAGLVLIGGEPGVGKTRLLAELAARARAGGATVLAGRCDADLGVPFQPFIEALTHLVRHAPRSRLRDHVERRGLDVAQLVPELPARLGLERRRADRGAPTVDARWNLFEAVVDLLTSTTTDERTLLVLDDLHCAGQPTLALLRHLLRLTPEGPVLVAAAFRPTEMWRDAPLAADLADLQRDGATRIELDGLTSLQVGDFLEAAAGRALGEPGRRFAVDVHHATGGNPFFVGQILRHLVESGTVVEVSETDRWRLADRVELPQGVVDAVERRLVDLDDADREVLVLAGVCGHEFDVDVLDELTTAHEPLDALERAQRRRLVEEAEVPGRYRFVHALVRDVLYGGLGLTRRAALHRRVADVLRNDPGTPPAVLAHHYACAVRRGDVDDAVSFGLLAAEEALDRHAWAEAAAHAERSLELLELAPRPAADSRAELLRVRTAALGLDAHPETWTSWRAAVEAARAAGDPRLFVHAAMCAGPGPVGGRDRTRERVFREALDLLDQLEPDAEERWAYPAWYIRYHGVGRDVAEARRVADERLVPFFDHHDPRVRRRTVLAWALLHARSPRSAEILDALARLDHEPDADWVDSYDRVDALASEGIARLVLAQPDDGFAALAEADDLGRRVQHGLAEAIGHSARSSQAILRGDLDAAEQLIDPILTGRGDPENNLFWYATQLMALRLEQGRLPELLSTIEEAELGRPAMWVLRLVRGVGLLQAGDTDAAVSALEEVYRDRALGDSGQQRSTELACATEIVAHAGAVDLGPGLLGQLDEYEGLVLVSSWSIVHGAADRFRAMVLMTLGRHDEALDALTRAEVVERPFASPVLDGHTRHWRAETLAARGDQGDVVEAHADATAARDLARRVGMTDLERRTDALLDRLEDVATRSS